MSLADAIRSAVGRSPAAVQASVTRSDGAVTLARGINGVLPSMSGSIGYGWEDGSAGAGPDSAEQSWTAALSVNRPPSPAW
jgi:hypothetical protein